jgi:TonB family protein
MKGIIILAALLLVFSVAGKVTSQTSPVLLRAIFPAYPPIAKASNTSGEIKLRATINAQGEVVKTEILSGHKLLDDTARYAAMQWKFEKLIQGTTERSVDLTMRFTLMPRCSDKRTHTPIFTAPYTVEIRHEKSRIICTHCSQKEEDEMNCKNP